MQYINAYFVPLHNCFRISSAHLIFARSVEYLEILQIRRKSPIQNIAQITSACLKHVYRREMVCNQMGICHSIAVRIAAYYAGRSESPQVLYLKAVIARIMSASMLMITPSASKEEWSVQCIVYRILVGFVQLLTYFLLSDQYENPSQEMFAWNTHCVAKCSGMVACVLKLPYHHF